MTATVAWVGRDAHHHFSKRAALSIRLIAGEGVEGDAHRGVTVQHRSRVAADPTQPNLRQIHLIQGELFEDLTARGFAVQPGDLGENVTTRGIDLLALPTGARLAIGPTVVIELTGLRNPCGQIEAFQKGLLAAVLDRAPDGALIRKAGVMGIIVTGGDISAGDTLTVTLPAEPHQPLERV